MYINIAVNRCSGFATSTQKGPFLAMLISHSAGTSLIIFLCIDARILLNPNKPPLNSEPVRLWLTCKNSSRAGTARVGNLCICVAPVHHRSAGTRLYFWTRPCPNRPNGSGGTRSCEIYLSPQTCPYRHSQACLISTWSLYVANFSWRLLSVDVIKFAV